MKIPTIDSCDAPIIGVRNKDGKGYEAEEFLTHTRINIIMRLRELGCEFREFASWTEEPDKI